MFVADVRQEDHANGSSNVASEMKKTGLSSVVLVGLIDNDKLKNMPRYFDDFTEYQRGQRVSIRQKEDIRVQHYLIVLDRAIETFLLYNAETVGIKLTDFGFSDSPKELQKRLKSTQIEDNDNYLTLLRTLQEHKAPDFVLIEQFLKQLAV
ncbi:MAG: hypothetical protein EAY79_11735 [Runella slithyformis]|nr:MAG: hypothetical protein EAY79_11735 [Runella slithyformis]TAF44492.1 MAG: hypothetical protein EAZ63_12270 [Runella slithyformis]